MTGYAERWSEIVGPLRAQDASNAIIASNCEVAPLERAGNLTALQMIRDFATQATRRAEDLSRAADEAADRVAERQAVNAQTIYSEGPTS